jgi:hypothetical protein
MLGVGMSRRARVCVELRGVQPMLIERRPRFASLSIVAGAAIAACTFQPGVAPSVDGGDGAADAPMPSCQAPVFTCADATTLKATCPEASEVLIQCAWGCVPVGAQPRCGELVPSGGGVTTTDLVSTGLGDATITGAINGSTGTINGGTAASVGGAYRQASNNIGVFRFKSLKVGALRLEGTRAIALVADGAIVIEAVIDARGSCGSGAGSNAGAGGSGGGNESDGSGSGGGQGSDTPNRGAGGGGHGSIGGNGGGGVAGGIIVGDAPITLLLGGAGGGGAKTSRGGGGGGALQLVSNHSITITATGGVNAGGCGGLGGDGNSDAGGGGGGAGGTILVEAPHITIAGALAVNGGGGGNRNNGNGSAGRLDRTAAAAATGGGTGGAGSTFAGGAGTGAGNNQANGGGGGAVGRIRLTTRSGAASELARDGAVLSPDLTDGATTPTTHGSANIR